MDRSNSTISELSRAVIFSSE